MKCSDGLIHPFLKQITKFSDVTCTQASPVKLYHASPVYFEDVLCYGMVMIIIIMTMKLIFSPKMLQRKFWAYSKGHTKRFAPHAAW